MAALEPDDPRAVGDYRLLSRLGVGGMGRVYLGRSPGGRPVAVKVVHAELVRRPEFRSRFRREVRAARLVSGAFTAPVIDADPDAPLPWLVTSYIAGPSLEQAVAERGPMPAEAVLALAAGLAEALVSIHGVNLVHRDLKPSNVLLAEDGPRVIDFGIVRTVEADSLTGAGHMAGSPGFMSPEQVNGGEVSPAGDVFCLGAVLAFAATGDNPFGDGPTPALLYRVVHSEPDVGAVADPTLRALITACLAKEPSHRPTPRDILAGMGPAGTEEATTALSRYVGQGTVPAEHRAGPTPTPGHPSYPPTQVFPTHSPTQVYPRYSPTRMDPAPSPPHTEPHAPAGSGDHPDRGARTRRAVLLSAAGAVAVAGTAGTLWFTRSKGHEKPGAQGAGPGDNALSSPAAHPRPIGIWPLDEASGVLARDTVGGHDGTTTDVRWGAGDGGAAEFDGKSSQIVTDGPVVETGAGHSFTVSAWVRLPAVPGFFATAVSQDGATASGFYLQFSGAEKRWAFARPDLRAVGYTVPPVNTWTHLVGVCDGPARKLRLYVDGVEEAAIDDTKPTVSTGPFVIGRARYNGQSSDYFPGAIKDVRVFDRALPAARVRSLG